MDFYYERLIAFQQIKRISILKKYLNELVKPSPNLPVNNIYDVPTKDAIVAFKYQFNKKNLLKKFPLDGVMNDELWAAIGTALGQERLKQEILVLSDVKLIRLLQGKFEYGDISEIRNCDKKLAQLFGGDGADVMTIIEPPDLRNADGSMYNRNHPKPYLRPEGHNVIPRNDLKNTNDRGGIIHIYANPQGLPGNVGVYAPAGFARISLVEAEKGEVVELKPKADNQQYFYNNNEQNALYIVYSHVKTVGVRGIGEKRANGSVKIGNIGGPRGASGDIKTGYSYVHTHIVFFSVYFGNPYTGTRVDPRNYFCK